MHETTMTNIGIINKAKALGSGILVLLVMSGCAQPQFNRNNKGIKFILEKPYLIPYGSSYQTETTVTKDDSDYLRGRGINCKQGSVVWVANDSKSKLTGNRIRVMNNFARLYKTGKSGCAKPLSKQEYRYVLNQQNQRSSNARANAQMQQQSINNTTNQLNEMARTQAINNVAMSNMNMQGSTNYNQNFSAGNSNSTYRVQSYGNGYYKVKQAGSNRLTWNPVY